MAVSLTLKVFKGDELIATKEFDRDIIKIGRLSSAHLCLEGEKVSRIHSVLEVAADGTLSIIDMGSVEGTFVNGKRVNKGALVFGDEIKIGNTTIKVEAGTGAGADASASEGLAMGSSTIVTDEPTSHLDLESINALNIALQKYEGTVLLVTHDQDLLEEVGTRVWHVEGGRVHDFKVTHEEFESSATHSRR